MNATLNWKTWHVSLQYSFVMMVLGSYQAVDIIGVLSI